MVLLRSLYALADILSANQKCLLLRPIFGVVCRFAGGFPHCLLPFLPPPPIVFFFVLGLAFALLNLRTTKEKTPKSASYAEIRQKMRQAKETCVFFPLACLLRLARPACSFAKRLLCTQASSQPMTITKQMRTRIAERQFLTGLQRGYFF